MEELVKLDGAYLEGGGQIVRNALALSVLTGKGFEVTQIRKGRCDSGLKPQHLHCVKAAAQLSDAYFEDVEIGSERILFQPKTRKIKSLDIDVGTAGSITLLLQSLLIPCMFSKRVKLTIKGGTDVTWSMPFDYMKEIFLPQLKRYADIDFKLNKRGYYPKGGGLIELNIS